MTPTLNDVTGRKKRPEPQSAGYRSAWATSPLLAQRRFNGAGGGNRGRRGRRGAGSAGRRA